MELREKYESTSKEINRCYNNVLKILKDFNDKIAHKTDETIKLNEYLIINRRCPLLEYAGEMTQNIQEININFFQFVYPREEKRTRKQKFLSFQDARLNNIMNLGYVKDSTYMKNVDTNTWKCVGLESLELSVHQPFLQQSYIMHNKSQTVQWEGRNDVINEDIQNKLSGVFGTYFIEIKNLELFVSYLQQQSSIIMLNMINTEYSLSLLSTIQALAK